MKKSYVLSFLISLILIVALIGYLSEEKTQTKEAQVTLTIKTIGNTTTEEFKVKNAKLSDILINKHHITLSRGFVRCVDSVCNENEYWWLLTVNNKPINYGITNYALKESDRILLEFTKKNLGD